MISAIYLPVEGNLRLTNIWSFSGPPFYFPIYCFEFAFEKWEIPQDLTFLWPDLWDLSLGYNV